MAKEKIESKVSGTYLETPVQVEHNGASWYVVSISSFVAAVMMLLTTVGVFSINEEMQKSNETNKERLRVEKQRTDLAKRQFTLDSLKYVNEINQKQK